MSTDPVDTPADLVAACEELLSTAVAFGRAGRTICHLPALRANPVRGAGRSDYHHRHWTKFNELDSLDKAIESHPNWTELRGPVRDSPPATSSSFPHNATPCRQRPTRRAPHGAPWLSTVAGQDKLFEAKQDVHIARVA